MSIKHIFVTYGNHEYYNSLQRIRDEVENTKLFDKILIYTDDDLPKEITENILFSYKRGGGYWLWKPWVILQAINEANDGDIIVYSDCGNTIYPNLEGWLDLFRLMKKHNAVFFYNGGRMYKWTRKSVFSKFGTGLKKRHYQIISNFFILNKTAEKLIYEWYYSMKTDPNLVRDVDLEERKYEDKRFIEHRHDQAVLSGVAYTTYKEFNTLIIPEKSERLRPSGQPVYNSRISDTGRRSSENPSSRIILFVIDNLIKPMRRIETWFLNR